MFSCRVCLRRSFNALLATKPSEAQLFISRTFASYPRQRQTYATVAGEHQQAEPLASKLKDKSRQSSKKLELVVDKHLETLSDPYHTANHVLNTLNRGGYEEALLLTQKASKSQRVTVSWNYLIDHQLKNQRVHAAVKLFNDMKKRGQLPNAQTYTILFRGLAASAHPKLAASEAYRIYQSMLRLDRPKPNTIHLNAVLETCAHAGDIDLLFTVVETADSQLRNPDNRTYTIILNALRSAIKPLPQRRDVSDEQHQSNVETSIQRAKSVWAEVLRRWKQHGIVMDESLVCSMGRLLLLGDHKDRKSVMALLQQTMQLPLLEDTPANYMESWPSQQSLPPATDAPRVPARTSVTSQKPANASVVAQNTQVQPIGYAVPSQNTLSLIMVSLRSTKNTTLAPKYWKLLTERHHVVPDRENYTRYLKALQHGHASTKTADLIPTIPNHFFHPKFFHIALQTCINDNLNQHAFANACRIFDDMLKRSLFPDAQAMRLYLHAARANYRHFQELRETDPVQSKKALCEQVVLALDRLWKPFRSLSSSVSVPQANSPEELWQKTYNTRDEIVAVARRMMAAVDWVVDQDVTDPSVLKTLRLRSTILRQYVSRFYAKESSMPNQSAK